MIIRQFCARHGRAALAQSSRTIFRAYATTINPDPFSSPALRPPERDARSTTRIPGHPDDPSSILDTIDYAPTPETRRVEELVNEQQQAIQSLREGVNAHAAARLMAIDDLETPESSPEDAPTSTSDSPLSGSLPSSNLKDLNRSRRAMQKRVRQGTHLSQTYDPAMILKKPPTADDLTLPMLLANQTHLGHATSLWNPANSGYIFGIRDGIHIISLDITYAYLKRAAKVVEAVARRGGIILFIGTRKNMEEVVVNSAKLAEGYHIFHRWVPGSLTNAQQILGAAGVKVVDIHDRELTQYKEFFSAGAHPALRPDLVICLNPIENEVCLHECGLFNVPTIGVIDTDANPTWVTYPIPANDDSFRSIALIGGVLANAAKEGQRRRKLDARSRKVNTDTKRVADALEHIKELMAMNVQAGDTEASDKDVD